ncbi:MAG: hypothetical protein ACE5EV_09195, partial [Gaiellales bacterium]
MRSIRPRHLAPALAATVALLLAACGGADATPADQAVAGSEPVAAVTASDPAARSALAAAASGLGDIGSARIELEMTVDAPDAPSPVGITMSGRFDVEAGRARLDLAYSGLLEALGSEGVDAGAVIPDAIVLDDRVLYIRFPNIRSVSPDAKRWARMDLAELGETQVLEAGTPEPAAGADPGQLLAMLEAIDAGVVAVGPETVRGVETTRYTATIDLARLGALVPAEQRIVFEAQLGQVRAAGLSEVPIDVWLDADGLVRRIRSEIRIPGEPDGT